MAALSEMGGDASFGNGETMGLLEPKEESGDYRQVAATQSSKRHVVFAWSPRFLVIKK